MRRWLATLFSPKLPKLPTTRLRLEQMEDRLQPSSSCGLGGLGGFGFGGISSDGHGGGDCGSFGGCGGNNNSYGNNGGGCDNGGGGHGGGSHGGGSGSSGSSGTGSTGSSGTGSTGSSGTGSTGTASVSGSVIYTLQGQDNGPAIGDTVTLTNAQGTVVANTTTDSNGNYSFSSLAAGTYTLTVYDSNIVGGSTTMSVTLTTGQALTESTITINVISV